MWLAIVTLALVDIGPIASTVLYEIYHICKKYIKMTRCCVPNCSETATHHFPKDKKIMKPWLRAIRRIDFIPKSGSRLCRKHFKESDFIQISKYTGVSHQHKFLKKSAVPSIFSWHEKPGSKQVEAREERIKIHNYRKSLFQDVPTTSSVPYQEQREESAGISYTIDIPGAETLVPISYPSTRVIIDGTEIPIQKPSQSVAQKVSFSQYKHKNTCPRSIYKQTCWDKYSNISKRKVTNPTYIIKKRSKTS